MTTDRIETTDIASQISKDISIYKEKLQKKKYRTSDSFTKKETLIEIAVFLLITFGLMLTFGWKAYSESGEKSVMTGLDMLFYYLTTFSPAIGCIATRYMFREGFRDDILFPKAGRREELPDGNMYDYFISYHRTAMLDIYGASVKG